MQCACMQCIFKCAKCGGLLSCLVESAATQNRSQVMLCQKCTLTFSHISYRNYQQSDKRLKHSHFQGHFSPRNLSEKDFTTLTIIKGLMNNFEYWKLLQICSFFWLCWSGKRYKKTEIHFLSVFKFVTTICYVTQFEIQILKVI